MPSNRFSIAFVILLPCLALAATPSLQEASQSFRQGQNSTALDKINGYLAGNPKDAQGRFLKGLILTELGRYQEAIKVFTDLTDDYPELPEPYNNLAVLHAAQGQYERAKQSLEMAIRTHPSYATAHENLGDIYAKMASLAYDKALQLDESNVSAQTKLALIKDLFGPTRAQEPAKSKTTKTAGGKVASTAPAPATQTEKPATPKLATPPLKPVETAAASPASTKPAAPAENPSPMAAAEPTSALAPKEAVDAPPPPSTPKPMTPAQAKAAAEQAVYAWATAWSKQDVDAYLSHYGRHFQMPRGLDRAAWAAERKERVSAPDFIKVDISQLRIDVRGNTAKARFKQRYEADHLKGTYRKTLELELEDGVWKIISER